MEKTTRIKKNVNRGFTLIELMIVVAILGILVSISMPVYKQYTLNAHRIEATASLGDIYLQQLAYFQENYHFASSDDLTSLEAEYYTITVTPSASDAANSTTFTITATAKSIQTSDTDCTKYTINHLNVKAAADSSDADTTAKCW